MAKWADAPIRGDFLGEAAQRELLNFLSVREGAEYGLCVARKTLRGQEVIELSGNVPGYTAAVLIQGDRVCAVLLGLSDYSGSGVSFAELIADEIMIYMTDK